jgi:signal transduction histidine kinase
VNDEHSIKRRFRACAGLVFIGLTTLCSQASSPMRVLILNPYSRDTEPFTAVVSAFRSTLGKEIREPVAFDEVPLDLAHFTEEEGEEPLVAFLAERIKRQPVDLVVPVGGASVRFVDRHREHLFPTTPILAVAAEPRMIPPGFLEKNATLVTQKIDLPGMVEDMLQMQPDTKQIAVVFGSSPVEKLWVGQCRGEFQSFSKRVEFVWLNDLPFEEMLDRCAKLPPKSFIFHGLYLEDALGIPIEKSEALRRLQAEAGAPVFACFSSEFGLGPVGGRLFRNSEIGAQAAHTALRILRGQTAESIPPEILDLATPMYDWRELRRWKIPEANLPPGSIIQFRQPSFWERYRWPVIGVISFGLFQAALIIGLTVNRNRRRRSEAEAAMIADISSKFVNLPADQVDREIFDAQRRICELMEIDLSALWQRTARHPSSFTATHLYSLEHGPQLAGEMTDDDFPWIRQEILAGRVVAHRSLADMPAAAAKDREAGRKLGIKSHLTLPLSLGGDSPIGILGFNTTRKERTWPPSLVERLKLVAEIAANALARKKADQDLRESEAQNRIAMEQTMELRDELSHSGRVTLLGQLASALAHELSQPLGAILRNAEAAEIMLQQPSPDLEEIRAIVDDILRDDHRAGQVIDKLRSLLKKGSLDVQPVDLSEVIAEVLTLVQAAATTRQVKLIFTGAPGLPMVGGDRIHLQQVLLNLIVNAMDALDNCHTHECAVEVHARQLNASTVEVRVCDNGPGIADEHQGDLFEPFFTTKTTGMGMGLPVSKTIIEAHKGKLWAENRPEGGACFCFTLPAIHNP